MNAYEFFSQYIALKQHFTTNYDYHKYHGKTKVSVQSFEKRKDKYFFTKLCKRIRNPINYLLANFAAGKVWIGDFTEEIYTDWQRRQESLTYIFTTELSCLLPDFDANFLIESNQHPYWLKLYLNGQISLETTIILLDLSKGWKYTTRHLKDDVLWAQLGGRLVKYRPFLKYDQQKFRQLTLNHFAELQQCQLPPMN